MFDDGRDFTDLDVSPALGDFPNQGLRKVDNTEQPERIEPIGQVYGAGNLPRPVGFLHAVHFPDGQVREIFTDWFEGPRNYARSVFLEPGRTSNKAIEVLDLRITNPTKSEDIVSDALKSRMRDLDRSRGWKVQEPIALAS